MLNSILTGKLEKIESIKQKLLGKRSTKRLNMIKTSNGTNNTIAFDVDGTLFDEKDRPRFEIIDLLRWYYEWTDWNIIIWSGGGQEYAEMKARQLGLFGIKRVSFATKGTLTNIDVAVDDQEVLLGKVNIKV